MNIKKISSKTTQLNLNGKIIDDDNELANRFNDFFVNVGPNTEASIPKVYDKSPTEFLKERNRINLVIAHISNEEILEVINSLDNKSSGPSSIPVNLLSLIPDLIIMPLSFIINLSLRIGVFPDLPKIVKVIPIHKGGSTQDINNYRPISLLSIFDKIFEKMIHNRLYAFLEINEILIPNQFGFRKKNSTVNALIQITEKIKNSIDQGKFGCGIFIDLRKAFDTVNHDILLTKLNHYGVRDNLFDWFHSYLTDRKQYVSINGSTSQLCDITCGVPQGSVLGPLLFLIYINDLPNISDIIEFSLFADDTNLYLESKSLKDLEITFNKELEKLYLWLNVNRLSLNIAKTNYIIFHPYNKPLKQNIEIKINGNLIIEKEYITYLGVQIDSTLSWKHCVYIVGKKISRAIVIMYKLKPLVPSKVMKTIYYSLVHFQYILLENRNKLV